MSGYFPPAQQQGYGYPPQQPSGYPPAPSPYSAPPSGYPPAPAPSPYPAASSPYPATSSPYPPQPQQPSIYQAPSAYPPQPEPHPQQQQQDIYPPPANAGYPGSPAMPNIPPQYQAPPGPPSGYPYDQKAPPSQETYPPPQSQPSSSQPYGAYQETSKGAYSYDVPSPAYAPQQPQICPPGPPGQANYGYTGGTGQKDIEFWMRAYPRPAYGPQPATPEQIQMWNYHINYNPSNKQKPPKYGSSSTGTSAASTPGLGGQAGSYYPGAGMGQQYAPGGQSPYPQQQYAPAGQSPYPQQQQQQPMYQTPPPAQEQHSDGKQGPDWMKFAGGMAAGGLALAGTKKLFEKFTEDKHKPAHHLF
ncbi:hypothetical protein BGZ54_006910 [Gamsiella multidivaricata]|nr:hypothetical protein BGZ54_006910 [Gamsiella multidivaricata]